MSSHRSDYEGVRGREDIRNFGIMFDPIMEHYEPGNEDSLTTSIALTAIRGAKRALKEQGLTQSQITNLIYDTTHEARHVHAWLATLDPEGFNEEVIY